MKVFKQKQMMRTTTNNNSNPNVKRVQRNILKRWNKYQVRKMVNGELIIESFEHLKHARAYLKSLA